MITFHLKFQFHGQMLSRCDEYGSNFFIFIYFFFHFFVVVEEFESFIRNFEWKRKRKKKKGRERMREYTTDQCIPCLRNKSINFTLRTTQLNSNILEIDRNGSILGIFFFKSILNCVCFRLRL